MHHRFIPPRIVVLAEILSQPRSASARALPGYRCGSLAVVACASVLSVSACASARHAAPASSLGSTMPSTRAERTKYAETSTYDDVVAFIEELKQLRGPMTTGIIGRTSKGRAIPYVVASRPLFATPESARGSGRPIVYIQANIHAGEVEGKEALQSILRDLLLSSRPNVLDSIVLIAVPIYNADGNERFDHQARNRGAQNGPEMVGQRPNAEGLDLNRDYIKAEAPETVASLAMFKAWDPHVFVDLHTTDGSYHGYNLTWSPSLNPAAELVGATFGGAFARDSLVSVVQRRLQERAHVAIYPYGNFSQDEGITAIPKGWVTYDHRPRFGTNYYALRGRISVLSEAYSHDPFERRVASTYAFVGELLSLVAERHAAIVDLARGSDAAISRWDGETATTPASVPVRARLTTKPFDADVVYEVLQPTADTVRAEPGVRRGVRRTGRFVTERMPVFDRFEPVLSRPAPWGYAIAPGDTAALRLMRAHGIQLFHPTRELAGDMGPQFAIDSVIVAARPFQGHREVQLVGTWRTDSLSQSTIPPTAWIVPVGQPLGVLVMYLLEPESDDGLYAWDIAGRATTQRSGLAIVRLQHKPAIPLERAP